MTKVHLRHSCIEPTSCLALVCVSVKFIDFIFLVSLLTHFKRKTKKDTEKQTTKKEAKKKNKTKQNKQKQNPH